MYLGDRDTLTYAPDAQELARFERTLLAIWRAIERARGTRDFRASPSRLCGWCDHKPLCPAHGGTPPPYPDPQPPPADVGAEVDAVSPADASQPAGVVPSEAVQSPTPSSRG
jgi:RecB family exonuclease